MRNLFIIFLFIELLSLNRINSQELKSELTDNKSLEVEKITELKDKTVKEIYKAVLNWTSYKFRNTESVIQSKVENEMIRISGVSSGVLDGPMGYRYGLSYIIQIEIKA
jgi:hypothetical protein